MIFFVVLFGLCWLIGIGNFLTDMGDSVSAPQQCVAVGVGIFTILVPYTALKAYYCWLASERQEELLAEIKKLNARQAS